MTSASAGRPRATTTSSSRSRRGATYTQTPPLSRTRTSPAAAPPKTHGFGDTLEHATRKVRGVRARGGAERWSHSRGRGRVAAHPGDYDDAQRRKRNELVLFLMETSGALSPPAKKHLRWLHRRSKGDPGSTDRTPYDGWAVGGEGRRPFVQYWTRRLSAAVVSGDARRTLNALRACAVRSSSF